MTFTNNLNLHSGNVLHSPRTCSWYISELGFCGPADKSPTSIYENLPYIAPEGISRKEYTFKSDIYSIGMLMWEISSGQPPFSIYEHDLDFAMNIINGMRPNIVPETPLEYKELMKQCWDADPSKRPDIRTLGSKISEINLHYQNILSALPQQTQPGESKTNYTSSKLLTSKAHQFEIMP